MEEYFTKRRAPSNAWLGTSVEDGKYGEPRISVLQRIATSVRFLSVEPLLEDVGTLNLSGISWVIVGGESGPHARPMKPEWARSVRDQCEAAGVSFFFKQWGSYGDDGVRRAFAEQDPEMAPDGFGRYLTEDAPVGREILLSDAGFDPGDVSFRQYQIE